MSRTPAGSLLFVVLLALVSAPARASDVLAERAKLYTAYAAALDKLGAQCEAADNSQAAKRLRSWLPERASDKLTLFVLPSLAAPEPQQAVATDDTWRKDWQAMRDEQAVALCPLRSALGRASAVVGN